MASSETLIEDPPWHRRLRRLAPWLVLLAILALIAAPGWLHELGGGPLIGPPLTVRLLDDRRSPDAGRGGDVATVARR